MALIGWKLTYTAPGGSPVQKTFAEWVVSGVRLRRQSQAPDELSFSSVEDVSAAPRFAYDGKIIIHRTMANGTDVQWYVGWVDVPSVTLNGTQRRRSYKVKGPWKWLDNLTFQKVWFKAVDPANSASSIIGGYRGKFVLNLDANNPGDTHQTVEDQVAEVVDYANQCAVLQDVADGDPLIAMGDCPATLPPWSDVNNITCAEAVKHQLKWMPGAVTKFDYSVDPPQLDIVIPSDVETIAFSEGIIGDAGLVARYDRQVSRVRLKFEQSNSTDGVNWIYEVWDIYPVPPSGNSGTFLAPAVGGGFYYLTSGGQITKSATAPPSGGSTPPPDNVFDELMLTVNLVGWTQQYARANITSEIWGTDAWIKKKLAFLKDTLSVLTDDPILRKVVYQDDSEYIPGVSGVAPTLIYELVGGAVTDGLVQNNGSAVSAQSYTVIYDVNHEKIGAVAGSKQDVQSIKFNAINVASGYYTGLQSSTPGDPVPTGLAQSLYEGLSELQHDGSIKLKALHAGETNYMGSMVTLTGGNPDWENMIVQATDENLDTGETILSVGVAKYLSAGDLVELLRVTRNLQRYIAPRTVSTGQGAAGSNNSPTRMQADNSAAGSSTPMVSSAVSSVPVAGVYPDDRMEVRTDAPGGRWQMVALGGLQTDDRDEEVAPDSEILLRLSDCAGRQLIVREYSICVNDVEKRVLLVGSEPYDPP